MLQLLEETGNGRDINRHFYSVEEAKAALDKPVVKALLDLCRFRNQHPAFNGEANVKDPPEILADWQRTLLVYLTLLPSDNTMLRIGTCYEWLQLPMTCTPASYLGWPLAQV